MIYFQDYCHESTEELWLADDVLPTDSITVLCGKDGQKNSQTALELALSVANGKNWQGKEVPIKQQVIYITVDGKNKIAKRTKFWTDANNSSMNTLFASIHDPINFFDFKQLKQLLSDISYCNLSKGYDEYPALVVIDIQGGFTSEPENNIHAQKLLNSINYLRNVMGSAFLLVYNEGSDEFCCGFISLFNAADSVHQVTKIGNTVTRLTCTKMKEFVKPNSVDFHLTCVDPSKLKGGL